MSFLSMTVQNYLPSPQNGDQKAFSGGEKGFEISFLPVAHVKSASIAPVNVPHFTLYFQGFIRSVG